MTTSDGTAANVIAYANPFPGKQRIEILVDWNDVSSWKNFERLSFNVYAVAQTTPPTISARLQWNAVQISLGSRFLSNDLWHKYHEEFSNVFEGISETPTLAARRLRNFLSIGIPGTPHKYDLADAPHPYFDVIRPRTLDKSLEDLNLKYAAYARRLLEWRRKLHELSNQNLATAGRAVIPPVSTEDRLAAIRHASRDEVTFGHALNTLHFFDLNELTASMKTFLRQPVLWLLAVPVDSHGTPLNPTEFVPIATRLVSDGSHLITYLEEVIKQDNVEYETAYRSFWANTTAVRQLISAEIPDHGSTSPKAALALIERNSVAPSLTISTLREAAKKLVRTEGITEAELSQKSGEIVEAVRTLESATVPYDKIGICWDRSSVMPTASPDYHVGYKGYRVDVFSDDGLKTETLCAAEIRVTTPTNAQFAFRESALLGVTEGYVDITVQKDPTVAVPSTGSGFNGQELALARDFCIYDGYSSVAQNPLDCLLKINSVGPSSPVVTTLENLPSLSYKLRYGNKLAIQIRKLGMTGMGPEPGYNGKLTGSNWLVFKRTVYVRSPEMHSGCKRLAPASTGTSEKSSADQAILRIVGSDPEIVLNLRYPTVHWKVAWHARGDMGDTIDPEFQSACEEFARRGVRQQLADSESANTDYLRAVDPHIKSVQVLTRIWYPFSDNKTRNRYVITGRRSFPIDAKKMTFPQLILKAEKRITDQSFDLQTDVPVSYPREFTYEPDHISDPVVLLGHHNQIECAGEWDEASSFQLEEKLLDGLDLGNKISDRRDLIESRRAGVTPWVWNLRVHPPSDSDRPEIGGKTGKSPEPIKTVHYAGLKTRHLERWLPVPPTKGTGGTTSPSAISSPARGSTFQWRNFVFPSKDKPVSRGLRDSYINFVLGMLGPCQVIDGKKDDSELFSVRIMPRDKGGNFVACGYNFPNSVSVAETSSGSLRYDVATLGRFSIQLNVNEWSERKLPFIEDDITNLVRLEWKFPIRGSHVQRPYDLAAVKEFRIFRTNSNENLNPKSLPIGSIARPSEATLRTYNLDEVSWVFFDAIQNRQTHEFQYHVLAVPEDERAFRAKVWATFSVSIPNSQFDSRPEPVQILPMFPVDNFRRVAMRVPASSRSLLAWRLLSTKQDPLLPTPPPLTLFQPDFSDVKILEDNLMKLVSKGTSQPGLDELFPSAQPATEAVYQTRPSEPFKKIEEGWQFCTDRVEDSELTTVWIQQFSEMPSGNPFFKLQLALYSPEQYPRLAHTAASEVFQTEWIQSYPSDLQFEETTAHANVEEIKIQNSWKYGRAPGDLLRYRFHFFVAEKPHAKSENAAFHLSTFYYSQPSLPVAPLRPKLQAAMRRFIADDLSELRGVDIYIVAEEGLMAPTYSVAENDGVSKSGEKVFVALRSSKAVMHLPASLWI